jgi:hypothetical protein
MSIIVLDRGIEGVAVDHSFVKQTLLLFWQEKQKSRQDFSLNLCMFLDFGRFRIISSTMAMAHKHNGHHTHSSIFYVFVFYSFVLFYSKARDRPTYSIDINTLYRCIVVKGWSVSASSLQGIKIPRFVTNLKLMQEKGSVRRK